MHTVSVARDFTRYPSGRYKRFSRTSGEEFRERFLLEPLRRGEPIVVDLDGTVGYGSSFLDEAFGGAARALRYPAERMFSLLTIKASDASLIEEIREYVSDAAAAASDTAV